jgi:uncharacterized membrane protein HdeD (DUF308 family)
MENTEREKEKSMETEEALTFETKRAPWWLLLLSGCLSILIGILLLANPARTAVALAWALGLYWFLQGTFTLIYMFIDRSAWGWKLFIGILGILAGIVVMRHPIASAVELPMILILVLGIQGIIVGIISLVMAFKGGGWGAAILGAISIVFGIILVLNFSAPGSVVAFFWVAGIWALIAGVVQIVHAFQQRKA